MADFEAMSTLVPGLGRVGGRHRRPLGWWYYAKKSFRLFPGVVRARSARFLAPYYARLGSTQSPLRVLVNAVTYGLFQLWLPFRTRQVARKYGFGADWAANARRIARQRFVDPNDLALFRITRPEQLDSYIRRFEQSAISKRINPACWQPGCVLANKIEFYARCVEFGLPHPRVLATAVAGDIRLHALPDRPTLAVKPAGGEGGDGFRAVDYAPGAESDAAGFMTFLRGVLGGKHLWVVQDMLSTHPDLAGIAMSALPTARVTTLRDEHGEPEIVTSTLRFPSDPAALVDNIKSGGLMAPIDLATGVLGVGCRGRGVGEFPAHPVTGAAIEGRRLPFWKEATDLAIDAHRRAFAEYTLVGWDIAFTPEGPVFIEGNGKPCMIVAQRAPRQGIGDSRYGALLAHHLSRQSFIGSNRNGVSEQARTPLS